MLKAKMTLSSINIPEDKRVPTRDGSKIETAFELRAKLKVTKRKAGSFSGEGIDSLELQWIETCDWFEFTNGTWQFKGTEPNRQDMHAAKPTSNTFNNWRTVRYLFASFNELGNNPPPPLTAAVAKFQTTADKDKAAKHWIAQNGFEWTLPVAVDRPAIGLKPVAGSGGGAGGSLVTSNSRRRVLYFDLGFKGISSPRVTATLILESVEGRPTIHKFLVPAISKAQADDAANLETWRRELR